MKIAKKRAYRRISFKVSFLRPMNADVERCQTYVAEAVQSWRGQYRPPFAYDHGDPGDPMFALDPDTVQVTRWNTRKRWVAP